MNEEIIRKYAAIMKELDLSGLEICEKDTKIKLERCLNAVIQDNNSASLPKPPEEAALNEKGCDPVKSPMVGVFYAAPAENADPFVKIGDKVKKGDTLCIIEAMKLMKFNLSGTVPLKKSA